MYVTKAADYAAYYSFAEEGEGVVRPNRQGAVVLMKCILGVYEHCCI